LRHKNLKLTRGGTLHKEKEKKREKILKIYSDSTPGKRRTRRMVTTSDGVFRKEPRSEKRGEREEKRFLLPIFTQRTAMMEGEGGESLTVTNLP